MKENELNCLKPGKYFVHLLNRSIIDLDSEKRYTIGDALFDELLKTPIDLDGDVIYMIEGYGFSLIPFTPTLNTFREEQK